MLTKERSYYKPFDYPWAFDFYQKQQQMHWLPSEVILADDLKDYGGLSNDQRTLVRNILRFFTQADVDVCGGYAELFLPNFKPPEIRMMLAAFAAMEGVHQEAYALLNETLGLPDEEYQEFYKYREMLSKHEFLEQCKIDTPADMARTLAVYSGFTEGVSLFSSFAILLNFQRFNLMKGMGQIVTWSIRDESLHVEGMTQLFRTFIRENPEIWDDNLKYQIYNAAEDIVKLEKEFIDLCFSDARVPGLKAEEVKRYVEYIANRRLLSLGMKAIFECDNNPLEWLDSLLSIEHVNFFENRSTSYAKGTSTGKWGDIFK